MEVPTRVRLTRCESGQEELAVIATLSREDAKYLINRRWWEGWGPRLGDPEEEPDRHWDWRLLISRYQNKPFYRAVCVKSADGGVQGAALYRVDALSALVPGARAVLVDRLATAPWNRAWRAAEPVFRATVSNASMGSDRVSRYYGFASHPGA